MPPMTAGTISSKQERAIIALLNEPTIAKAATACGVSERTLYGWMNQPAFVTAYHKARRQAFGKAIALLQQYGALAAQTLAKVMIDPASPASAKVSAANIVLNQGRNGIELEDVVQRMEALEKGVKESLEADKGIKHAGYRQTAEAP